MSGWRRSGPDLGRVATPVWVGLAVGGGFVALAVLMVVGSALADPGGLTGAAVALGVLVPLLLLCAWALLRPAAAVVGLAVLALAPVGFGVWQLLDHSAAWDFEERNGPVSLVLAVLVAAPAVVLGLSRARAALYVAARPARSPVVATGPA